MLSANQNHRNDRLGTSKLLQRQQNNPWIPSIFRYVFPRNAFLRSDQWAPPHFSFPNSPDRPDVLGVQENEFDLIDMMIPSDITDILNSIVVPDEFSISLPPPPLELDATKAIPGLDLSNDYLESLNSDYMEHHRYIL